jgi:thiamine-phosphate pyrophosphorylase
VSDTAGSRLVVVTDGAQARAAGHDLVAVVAAALEGGAGAVLLREKHLARGERLRLAEALRSCTEAAGATLHVAGDPALARAAGAAGVHLAAQDPWPRARERLGLVVGRSCHTVPELTAARAEGAHRVTYSPVFATVSKPGYGPSLGLGGLAVGCQAVPGLAVVALGGIEARTARACLDAGAAGVALMGVVMRSDDAAAVVRDVVRELEEAAA